MVSSTWKDLPKLGPHGAELDCLLRDAQASLARAKCGVRAPPHMQSSWNRFYVLSSRLIRRTLARRGVWRADLDDEAEEVWIQLICKLPDFRSRGPGCASAFIRKIARDRAAQFWRKAGQRKETPAELAFLDAMPAADPDPSRTAAGREDVEILREAIERVSRSVPWAWSQVLQLYMLGPFPAAAVARSLEVSEAWVRDVARRLRQKIEAEMAHIREERRREHSEANDGGGPPWGQRERERERET